MRTKATQHHARHSPLSLYEDGNPKSLVELQDLILFIELEEEIELDEETESEEEPQLGEWAKSNEQWNCDKWQQRR